MAALNSNYITLADIAKRQNTDKTIADMVEILAQQSPVARAGYAMECNDGDRTLTTLRASIPSPDWVQFYSRITPTKTTSRQVTDTTGMLEKMTSIDKRLFDKTKDRAKLRMQEALGILEGFAQEVESTFFYGNTGTSPLEFLGLAPRMNSLSAENGRMIVDGGGTGSTNTSIYLVTWGPMTAHLLYPEGTTAGAKREDKGVQRSETTEGVMWVVEEMFSQHVGFAMPDWRYNGRIANIDVSKLGTASEADLIRLLIKLMYKLPSRKSTTGFSSEGQPVSITPTLYCNTTVKEYLEAQMLRQPNGTLTRAEFMGQEVTTFRGMPILETDGIINTESRVT